MKRWSLIALLLALPVLPITVKDDAVTFYANGNKLFTRKGEPDTFDGFTAAAALAQELDRDRRPGGGIDRPVHIGHPARAQERLDAEAPSDHRAGCKRRAAHCPARMVMTLTPQTVSEDTERRIAHLSA